MVAVIKTGHSIHRILNYNENKVKDGVAECIGAGNYPIDHDEMSLNMKLNRFLKQNELRANTKRNSVHISLNFDVSEIDLPKEKLMEIADTYMKKIGFGNQPYLVYQHNDAGHPHIHLVTTNIEASGERIDLHHLGIRMSEPARKSIEKIFGLVNAESQIKQDQFGIKPISAKAEYGKSETKRAIQNVLNHVVDEYKFTSLHELNAVLRQYNVIAERGAEDSRIFKNNGLLYRILDKQGQPIGVPIKASLFYSKSVAKEFNQKDKLGQPMNVPIKATDFYHNPTLKALEQRFQSNEAKRSPHKARIRNTIDRILSDKDIPISKLIEALEKQGIYTALRKNEAGMIYGITYVDHNTKCVFNGSALGKNYAAKSIQERCKADDHALQIMPSLGEKTTRSDNNQIGSTDQKHEKASNVGSSVPVPLLLNLLDALSEVENADEFMPNALKKKRKRRKKRKNL